ncbi:MAG: PIG-L family deacetylase [Bdellovibrionales bacterium]|jgi:LmbE family N-acetylglucosaminyl deacetylase
MTYLVKRKVKAVLNYILRWTLSVLAKDAYATLPDGLLFIIAPHPDDETFGCGALIARARQGGKAMRVLIITDGAASCPSQKMPPNVLAATRRGETQRAAQILGVEESSLVFLDYPDGGAEKHISAIAKDIANQLWLHKPVVLFSPYGLDGHRDHRAVAKAIDLLDSEGKITIPVFDYPMWFWPRGAIKHLFTPRTWCTNRKISALGFLSQKEQAIHAHKSQCENITKDPNWPRLSSAFIKGSLQPYEIFFERPRSRAKEKPFSS